MISRDGAGPRHRALATLVAMLGAVSWLAPPSTLADTAGLAATIDSLVACESRVPGYPGHARAAHFLERELRRRGVADVRREAYEVVAPMDRGASLHVDGQAVPLRCLWPNLVRTPTLPEAGLEAPLIDGGRGTFADFDGQDVAGSVVLLDYDSWGAWRRAAYLGAAAVVFVEPTQAWRLQGDGNVASIPLDLPRFWIDREAGLSLRRRLRDGAPLAARLRARMEWATQPATNLLGWIPGGALAADTVVVHADYASASPVPSLAPGAEASAGVVTLLRLADQLRRHPPARTILLLATGGREGVTAFLERHARSYEPALERLAEPFGIDLFLHLDLSSQTDQLAVWHNTTDFQFQRYFAPFGRHFVAHAEAAAAAAGVEPEGALINGISPPRGLSWAALTPARGETGASRALAAGLPSLSFVTVRDGRFRVGTPHDRLSGVDVGNLDRQAGLLCATLAGALSAPELLADLEDFSPVLQDRLRSLLVRTRAFSRQSQVPDEPVVGALVTTAAVDARPGTPPLVAITDDRGEATIHGLPAGSIQLSAYQLDRDSGEIVGAVDLSERASSHHGKAGRGGALTVALRGATTENTVVVFPCTARELYDVVEPRFLSPILDGSGIRILDPNNVPPRQYGYALGPGAAVLFGSAGLRPEDRVKILLGGDRVLLLNSGGDESVAAARGQGFLLARDDLRGLHAQAARDMWHLDEVRLRRLRKHAIDNPRVTAMHEWTARLLQRAEVAAGQRRWGDYAAAAREALGVESRVYPEVLGTLNDVIRGIVFFLALVVPAAFFSERLFLGAADIRRQIAGTGLCLLVIWIAISQVHPAFELAHPLVILLSFAIMAMAVLVMALVFSRFEGHMKEFRSQLRGIHRADVSRVGASYAAFMLGISNMRRRRLRTGLTLATLILLTFTVLSFTTFQPGTRFLSVALDGAGAYEGVLVRDRGWLPLDGPQLDYTQTHFAGSGTVSPRGWYLASGAAGERHGPVAVTRGRRSANVSGLLGLAPQETAVTRIDSVLRRGSYFAQSAESSCLVPEAIALALDAVVGDSVTVFGRQLRVSGIVDSDALEALHDLDGGSLTPVDFGVSLTAGLEPERPSASPTAETIQELQSRSFTHQPADRILILPYETLRSIGGDLRSVAVRFEDGTQGRRRMEDYLRRFAVTLFAGFRDRVDGPITVASFTSMGSTSVEGIGALVVPIVIAGLIVLNTMLGAVYERIREIGIYSSVGLAPGHIAMLFIAEACVYAVLGIVTGYLLGQGLGRALLEVGWLSGLSLNYSSTAAVYAALVVMLVVLASTLYPARMASRLAVPDVVRRWRPPEPQGRHWSFQFPFVISRAEIVGLSGYLCSYFEAFSEESVGDFYTRDTRLQLIDADPGPRYSISTDVWLAPLELGVSQHLVLEATPEADDKVYGLHFEIEGRSGETEAWKRLNLRFMQVLRKRFLIWYSLRDEDRLGYRTETEARLRAADLA